MHPQVAAALVGASLCLPVVHAVDRRCDLALVAEGLELLTNGPDGGYPTFGSGGIESSMKDLIKAQPDAIAEYSYGVRAARLDAMPAEIDQFLKEIKLIPGDYVQLGEFTDVEEVTPDEEYIFIKAIDNYPMLNAKARLAAKRAIPGGTEYVFIAEDQPREFKDDMPPAGKMKVYVNVIGDNKPEFTRVVR